MRGSEGNRLTHTVYAVLLGGDGRGHSLEGSF